MVQQGVTRGHRCGNALFHAILQSSLHQGAAPLSPCCRPDADVRRSVARTAKLKALESNKLASFWPAYAAPTWPRQALRICNLHVFHLRVSIIISWRKYFKIWFRLQIPIKKKNQLNKTTTAQSHGQSVTIDQSLQLYGRKGGPGGPPAELSQRFSSFF